MHNNDSLAAVAARNFVVGGVGGAVFGSAVFGSAVAAPTVAAATADADAPILAYPPQPPGVVWRNIRVWHAFVDAMRD